MGIETAEDHELLDPENVNFPEEIGVSLEECRFRMSTPQPHMFEEVEQVSKFFEEALVDYPLLQDAVSDSLQEMLHYRIFWYLLDFSLSDMSEMYFDILRFRNVPYQEAEEKAQECDEQCETFENSPGFEVLKQRVVSHLARALELEKK